MAIQHYIGLMSGTSVDGIDAVLMAYCSQTLQWKTLATQSLPLSDQLTHQIHRLSLCDYGSDDPIDLLGETDRALGLVFADAVEQLVKANDLTANDISAIGSHGQTIRHRPPGTSPSPFTLQIGDPNLIAWNTGITTIADFRRKDMAAGGQGAPLAPAFHQGLFASTKEARILVNIGGISNITYLTPNEPPRGCDCGPGNTLMDAWIFKHQQKTFDHSGQWAQSGTTIDSLLSGFNEHPFLKSKNGNVKSSGREVFNLHWVEQTLKQHHLLSANPTDIQATLTEFTAQSIANEINRGESSAQKVYVCGGGAFNDYLMQRLQARLPQFEVITTAALGIEPDWVEAAGFAWLAKQRLDKIAAGPHRATGAQQSTILGGIFLPH